MNGYKVRLIQVLNNLLSNAIKFTPKNGVIYLSIAVKRKSKDQYTLGFSVKDSGIVIPKDDIKKLFKPFYQVKNNQSPQLQGSGLGLAISQNLVRGMGGEISCQSTLKQGSIFSFEIPLSYEHTISDNLAEQTNKYASVNSHILLVDDDPINRMLVTEILKPYAETITEAGSGQQALAMLNEASFSIIFMDVQMPEMDGYATTRQLRQLDKHRNTPIIAMTANASEEDYEEALKAGMNNRITKPIAPATLIDTFFCWCQR